MKKNIITDEADITVVFKNEIRYFLEFDKKKQCVKILLSKLPLNHPLRNYTKVSNSDTIFDVYKLNKKVWFGLFSTYILHLAQDK